MPSLVLAYYTPRNFRPYTDKPSLNHLRSLYGSLHQASR
ncbi:hypothetical protein [Salmonella phage SD-6_S16]|nr:hypothetical protein [Salmonella phage SD-6_S16]